MTIPKTAAKIQEGLYLNSYTKTIGSKEYTFRHLYSEEGYCFYDKTSQNQRTYMKYASLGVNKPIDDFASVKIQEDFIIV